MRLISSDLFSILQCPATKKELHLSNDTLVTPDGKRSYPFVNDIAWLFKDPEYFMLYWSNKKSEFINYHKLSAQNIEVELKNHKLGTATRARLELLKKAHDLNQQSLSEILKSLSSSTQGLFDVAVPSHQSLHLYRKNLFRDWGWDTDENETSLSLVKDLLGSQWKPSKFAVLGSGASRLAMDLHSEFKLNR